MSGLRRRMKNQNARWRNVLQALHNNNQFTKGMTRDIQPLMVNTYGMVINAIHRGEIGRGGYFPQTSGTSEAQFIMIKANALAYELTGNQEFKDRAEKLCLAAQHVMYRRTGTTFDACIPHLNDSDDTIRRWMPHWLFNVGAAFQAKGPPMPRSGNLTPQSDGVLMELVPVDKNGIGRVAKSPEKLAQMYRAYSDGSRILWQNCVADIFPPPIGAYGDRIIPILWFIAADRRQGTIDPIEPIKCTLTDDPLTDAQLTALGLDPTTAPGSFKVQESNVSIRVNYSTYTGAVIQPNQPFDAWPMWRDIYPQETLSAFDSLFWAGDAYKHMWEIFEGGVPNSGPYYRAYALTMKNIDRFNTLVDSQYLWVVNANTTDAKSETGNDYYSVPDQKFYKPDYQYELQPGPNPTWVRDGDGFLTATLAKDYTVPPKDATTTPAHPGPASMAFHHYAFAANTIFFQITKDTTVTGSLWSNKPQTLELEFRSQKNYDVDHLYYMEIDVDGANWNSYSFFVKDMLKYAVSIWKPGVSYNVVSADGADAIPVNVFSNQPVTPEPGPNANVFTGRALQVKGTISSSGYCEVQFYPDPQTFKKACPTKLPKVYVRRAKGSLPMYAHITLADSTSIDWLIPESDTIQAYDLEALAGKGVGLSDLSFKYIAPAQTQGGTIELYVWKVKSQEQLSYPIDATSQLWVAGCRSHLWEAHVLKIGATAMAGYGNKALAYNPGVSPYTVDLVNGSLKQWRGSPYVGYQGGEPWLDLIGVLDRPNKQKYINKANTLWAFYFAAQKHYYATSGDSFGPFAPVYLWPLWEDIRSSDPQGNFSWAGADPNTGWGGYMARAYYESAKFLWLYKYWGVTDVLPKYAPSIVMNALRHFERFMKANSGQPVSTYLFTFVDKTQQDATVQPVADYPEPHIMSLVVRAALYANMFFGDTIGPKDAETTGYIINAGLDYIFSRYNRTKFIVNGGECAQGAFSTIHKPGDKEQNSDGFSYYGFHNAEILQTLCLVVKYMPDLNLTGAASKDDTTDALTVPAGPVAPLAGPIADILRNYLAYIGRFQKPSGAYNAYVPMLINSDTWLASANMHPGPNSVGAHETAGTSEGQFIMAKGMAYAYSASQLAGYQDKAAALLNAAVKYLYPTGLDATSETDHWFANWLMVVKYPVPASATDHFVGHSGDSNVGQPVSMKIGDRCNTEGGNSNMWPDAANAAGDQMAWAAEAYWQMWTITGDTRWKKLAMATANSSLYANGFFQNPALTGAGSQYVPGCTSFTINTRSGAMVYDYRGPMYSGYQSPLPAILLANSAAVKQCYQFWSDAQDAYKAKVGVDGPFAPVFIPNRPDSTQYGAAGSWGWAGPDGNTSWGGFQYRAFEEAAKGWRWCLDHNVPVPTVAKSVVGRFLAYLFNEVTAHNAVPNTFTSGAAPADYGVDPHNAALAMRACIFAYVSVDTQDQQKKAMFCIQKIWASILTKLNTDATSDMFGSFSTDPANHRDFTFHIGEVLNAIAQSRIWSIELTGSTTDTTTVKDTTPPTLSGSVPASNATAVSTTAAFVLTFSEKIVKGSGSFKLRKASDGSVVEEISVNNSNVTYGSTTVTIQPSQALVVSTAYILDVPANCVADAAGNGFTAATSINFTSAGSTTGTGTTPTAGIKRVWAIIGGDQAAVWFTADSANGGVAPADHFLNIYSSAGNVKSAGINRTDLVAFNATMAGSVAGNYPERGSSTFWFDGAAGAPSAAALGAIQQIDSQLSSTATLDGVILTLHEKLLDMLLARPDSNGQPYNSTMLNDHYNTMTGFAAYLRAHFNNPALRIGVMAVPPELDGKGNETRQDQRNAIGSKHTNSWTGSQGNKTKEFGYINASSLPAGVTYLMPVATMTAAMQDLGYSFGNSYGQT